ncbi:MAG: hypothetical protein WC815_20515 [Vicinamibacterales bacterium]
MSTPASEHRARLCEPVTMGLPFPAGLVREPRQLALENDEGRPVPLQARVTEHWGDGSIRWALLDFQITGPYAPHRRWTLRIGPADPPASASRLAIEVASRHVGVDTGAAQFIIRNGAAFPFASVTSGGHQVLDAATSGLLATTPADRSLDTRFTRVSVEEDGPLRSTIRVDGSIGPARSPQLLLVARLHFFAGSSAVRVALTVRNPRRARHQGGLWELGDSGSVYLRDLSLRLGLATRITRIECACEAGAPLAAAEVPVEIYQDSSGGPHWRNISHVDRHGEIPCTFRGYRIESAGGRREGLRATPVMVARHSRGRVGFAVEHFWQNWPRAAGAEPDALVLRLFPGQCANEHELQGGEQKTHRFTLIFGDDDSARDAEFWGRASSLVRATPAWYCDSRAVAHLTPSGTDRYQQLVDAAIEGPASFAHKREAADEYGWRHWGDLPADHENAFSGRAEPVVSHYNNQYDAIAGCALQFLRSGDGRWHQHMTELAGHVADIDIYHTDGDKIAYNHGLFWHTAHYVTAGRSSHRSFPRDPKVNGGGPANEHNYTNGLRLHWLLTGEPQSREAAIALATWVVNMDDGTRTILRWLSQSATGLASQTYSPAFHGPGRGAGHSILALLDGHRLTHDEMFLEKADELVRRCIHPADDIARLNLLDAERRWSYTVFLQALGRYLDYRVELNRLDFGYAYARAALTHYARWMAEHEYPYLDRPEILEYPTETWAAQDMRKCDVFLFAAGHTSGRERDRFIERAGFFFDYSVSTLLRMPTHTLTRPLVLMLSNGYLHLSPHAATPRPEPRVDLIDGFGQPSPFVPQKQLAKQRLTVSASAGAALLLVTISLLAWF